MLLVSVSNVESDISNVCPWPIRKRKLTPNDLALQVIKRPQYVDAARPSIDHVPEAIPTVSTRVPLRTPLSLGESDA